MRVLITGDLGLAHLVRQALDAAHARRPIVIVLYTGQTVAALAAEQWASQHGILCGDVWEGADSSCIFDLADSIIALPGTSDQFLAMAREREAKVWQPYKVKPDC
ncbi:hypothetical protein D3C76_649870 [compost metagenome]